MSSASLTAFPAAFSAACAKPITEPREVRHEAGHLGLRRRHECRP